MLEVEPAPEDMRPIWGSDERRREESRRDRISRKRRWNVFT